MKAEHRAAFAEAQGQFLAWLTARDEQEKGTAAALTTVSGVALLAVLFWAFVKPHVDAPDEPRPEPPQKSEAPP